MQRLALGIVILAGLALFAGHVSASREGRWVMTDIDHAAQLAFPDYDRRYLVTMTAGGRVIWTAQPLDRSRLNLEVFQWLDGTVSDLGPLPTFMQAIGSNSGGAIVGASQDPPYCALGPDCRPGPSHAYLWRPGKATPLGSLGGRSSVADSINDRGQIVGWSETRRGVRHAFLWQSGKMVDISPRGTLRSGAAINNRGQVLMYASFENRAGSYLWRQGKLTKLGRFFQGVTMNDGGQVVGVLTKPGWRRDHVAVWKAGRITDLGASDDAYPSAITNSGDVVFRRVTGARFRAILWHDGKFTDLGDPGGGWTFPAAINDRGQIVGTSTLPGSKEQDYHAAAFVWQDGKMTRLPESPDFLDAAMAIDASGTHIAFGWPRFTCTAKSCAGQIVLWTYKR